jgi:hypothetical protein
MGVVHDGYYALLDDRFRHFLRYSCCDMIEYDRRQEWDEREREVLRLWYATARWEDLEKLLPGRKRNAVQMAAHRMGLEGRLRHNPHGRIIEGRLDPNKYYWILSILIPLEFLRLLAAQLLRLNDNSISIILTFFDIFALLILIAIGAYFMWDDDKAYIGNCNTILTTA